MKRGKSNRNKELLVVRAIVYHTLLTLVKIYSIDRKTLATMLKEVYHLFDVFYRED